MSSILFTHINEVLNQHAEWCAPVTNVVLAKHRISNKLEHSHNGIADDCGTQMPNVHFFGNVWSRVVNNDCFWSRRGTDA